MITPAYAPTATERVLPRLALDFTTGVLDSRVTVTRALNTATRVNSSGFIETVNADTPRFDYDPVTIAPRGLLIEETRANLAAYSQTPSDANWAPNGTSKTSTNNADPFNTSTALLLTADGASSVHFISIDTIATIAYTSGTTYTISCFAKPGTATRVQLTGPGAAFGTSQYANFLLSGNGSVSASSGGTATITRAPNGYYRLSFSIPATATTTANAGAFSFIVTGSETRLPTTSSSDNIYLIGWQVEAGAFPTSYIPTTTTSLTRNADAVSMTGTNFSDWYNASEGSFLVVADSFANVTTAVAFRPFSVTSGSNGTLIGAYLYNGSWGASSLISFATQFDLSRAGLYTANTPVGIAIAYKLNDSAAAIAGTATLTDTSCNVPTVDRLTLGRLNGIDYLNGHVQKLSYWPQRLINNEVRAFSK